MANEFMPEWFQAVVNTITKVWAFLDRIGVRFWAFVMFILTLVYEGFTLIGDLTIQAVQKISDLASAAGSLSAPCGGGLATILATANTFYPLDETLRMLAGLAAIWVVLGMYRFIRSWMPEVWGFGFPSGGA